MSAPNHVLPMGAVPADRVSFPRSEDRADPTYSWQYRIDMAGPMESWVKRALVGFTSTSQIATRKEAERRAVAEVKRPLHLPERLLLASAVRDWIYRQAEETRR